MKYQPLNDLIDPDVQPEGAAAPVVEADDPDAPCDAYVIGAHGKTVQAPDAGGEKTKPESGPRPWVKPVAVLLGVACVALTIWNLSRVVSGPPAPPKPTPFQTKQALYLGVMRVEAFRKLHGVTPETLREAGVPEPPYAYRRISPTQYVMSIQADGPRLEYDSMISTERFFGPPQTILSMGGSE